jgi:hypothetical protein
VYYERATPTLVSKLSYSTSSFYPYVILFTALFDNLSCLPRTSVNVTWRDVQASNKQN